MIISPHAQGTDAWKQDRLGLPTASQFHRIVTPTGKLSTQSTGYMAELLAEWMTGESEHFTSGFTERGNDMEVEAVKWYEFERSVDVQRVGFCLADSRCYGASPDGLVGDDGCIEIKCKSAKAHANYMLDASDLGTKDHKPQVQGVLWVCERKWCDVISYHNLMPPVVVRVERDEDYIALLTASVREFVMTLRTKLKEYGCI